MITRGFLALAGLLLVLGLHNYYPLPSGTQLWASYRDALHVPMFMLVATLFWWLLSALPQSPRFRFCLVGCSLFAVVSEAIQLLRAVGTASIADLGVDLLASVLTLMALWLLSEPKQHRRFRTGKVGLLVLSLTGLALYPVWTTREAYVHLESIYPRLTDYTASSPLLFHACRTRCELHPLKAAIGASEIGLLVSFEGQDWPGVNLLEVLPPTSAHQWLVVDFELHGGDPMDLFVILNPSQFTSPARTVQRKIYPTQTSISISLQKLMSFQPKGETLRIGLFTGPQFSGRQITIHNVAYGI